VVPFEKVRTYGETHDPGGGGVNVARVLAELGADTCAVVLAGGVTGDFLVELLARYGIPIRAVPVAGTTRISTTVHDRATGQEYRFVPEGPMISPAEFNSACAALAMEPADWVVLSGSLPRGVEPDAYARIAAQESGRGRHVVLDTSGPALRAALGSGLSLLKASRRELEELTRPRRPRRACPRPGPRRRRRARRRQPRRRWRSDRQRRRPPSCARRSRSRSRARWAPATASSPPW
jgi:6-phosphofructokinase 2